MIEQSKELIYFKNFITSIPGGEKLTPQNHIDILYKAELLTFQDGEDICTQGIPCDTIGILYSGMFKRSEKKNNISKITDLNFIGHNIIVSDFDSIVSEANAKASIISVKKSIVVCIHIKHWNAFYNSIHLINGIARHMSNQSNNAKQLFLEDYEGMYAKQMYDKLKKDFPLVCKNLTIDEVCSFLNIHRNSTRKIPKIKLP